MTVGIWELTSLVTKWLGLLAVAGVVGGSFVTTLAHKLRFPVQPALRIYLQASAVLGLLATPLYFLLQVGAVNQNGVAGMFDPVIGSILLQSGLGQVMGLRMLGFVLVLGWLLQAAAVHVRQRAELVAFASSALLLCASFVMTGHISTLNAGARGLLALHVLAVMLWIGALYPLLLFSRRPERVQVQKLMRIFGTLALGIVAGLLLSGLYLVAQVLQTPSELWSTPYGRTLLLKLTGVCALLLFAAVNKLVLVPKLLLADTRAALRRSIGMELGVALVVLAVTSWLTTVTGPAGL